MADRELIELLRTHVAEMGAHNARADELIAEIREEVRLTREQHELSLREHQRGRREHLQNQARFESTRSAIREMVLELREGREMLADMRHGIQANTEGLLRVLDELRRNDGSSPAGA